jgi:hypothetical protein
LIELSILSLSLIWSIVYLVNSLFSGTGTMDCLITRSVPSIIDVKCAIRILTHLWRTTGGSKTLSLTWIMIMLKLSNGYICSTFNIWLDVRWYVVAKYIFEKLNITARLSQKQFISNFQEVGFGHGLQNSDNATRHSY